MNADKHFHNAPRIVLVALLAVVLIGVIVAAQARASAALVVVALSA